MAILRSRTTRKCIAKYDPTKSGFLDLPTEIRLQIYSWLFTNPSYPTTAGYTLEEKQPVHMDYTELSAQLFRTCSTIRDEAHPVLYSMNSFLIHKPSELPRLLTAAGKDIGLITELCFQKGCKLIKPRVEMLQEFSGLKTVIISFDGCYKLFGGDKKKVEREAARLLGGLFYHVADCIKARPDLTYKLRIPIFSSDQVVGRFRLPTSSY